MYISLTTIVVVALVWWICTWCNERERERLRRNLIRQQERLYDATHER